jgi:hypothetical protein
VHEEQSEDVGHWELLLLKLLAEAADYPRIYLGGAHNGLHPDPATVASIVDQAMPILWHPPVSAFAHLPRAQAALFQIVLEAATFDNGALWLRETLERQLGVPWEDLVAAVAVEATDNHYGPLVARFHDVRSEYRWVDVDQVPPPRNPCKLPPAEGARLRGLAPGGSFSTGRSVPEVEVARKAFAEWLPDAAAGLTGWPLLTVSWIDVMEAVRNICNSTSPWSAGSVEAQVGAFAVHLQEPVRSMFFDPVTYTPEATYVSNGQHRLIAMAVQHVPQTLVSGP